ncbi:hypothetical protein SD51_09145 [Alicyclobacillus tengchongensis]|nr:hypothetical protein SD51_09145 [Alicyclobacillus tengchongensis]
MERAWTFDDMDIALEHGLVQAYRAGNAEDTYYSADPALLEDALTAVALGKNLLLRGPTGSGKTRLAESLAARLRLPMESINCSVDLDAEALLGFKTLAVEDEQSVIRYVEGPVVRAMRRGHLLYIDEINMARPEALPILNGVLDYRRQLSNPFTAETITAHHQFRVIAAINEGYVGTAPMNEALKNRFVVVDVPYIQGASLAALIERQSELRDTDQIRLFTDLSGDLVAAVRTGEVSEEAASIRALLDACDLAAHIPPLRAVRRAIAAKLDDEREQDLVMQLAAGYFGVDRG